MKNFDWQNLNVRKPGFKENLDMRRQILAPWDSLNRFYYTRISHRKLIKSSIMTPTEAVEYVKDDLHLERDLMRCLGAK